MNRSAYALLLLFVPHSSFAFDYGPTGNALYWAGLVLWSLVATQFIYNRRTKIGVFLKSAFARKSQPHVRFEDRVPLYEPTRAPVERYRNPHIVADAHHVVGAHAAAPRRYAYGSFDHSLTQTSGEILERAKRALVRSHNAREGLGEIVADSDHHHMDVRMPHESRERDHHVHVHEEQHAPMPEITPEKRHTPHLTPAKVHTPHSSTSVHAHMPVPRAVAVEKALDKLEHAKAEIHDKKHPHSAPEPVYTSVHETFADSLTLEKEKDGTPRLVLKRSKV